MSDNNVNYFRFPPPGVTPIPNSVYNNHQFQTQQRQSKPKPTHLSPLQSSQSTTQQPTSPQQQWNWRGHQFLPPNFTRPPPSMAFPPPTHIGPPLPRSPYSVSPNQRPFLPRTRFNNGQNNNGQQNWNKSNFKRIRYDADNPDLLNKTGKKRKKPLSQNTPKKLWTYEDAEKALNVEKEHNKLYKNRSLIIKFPDVELNKEIVSKFHDGIENIHFQQPSTARFCFVTLRETVDADAVIADLNKQEFGGGYLTVEYKKDREDDQNIGPGEIDPLTLYVGNLAQEITKEDMVKAFPKCKRIDIGYAKKMKKTRYAFVVFNSVEDAVVAFRATHGKEMYSKSLIVRFRRLHGTIGMPGESKPQNPPKNRPDEPLGVELPIDLDDYQRAYTPERSVNDAEYSFLSPNRGFPHIPSPPPSEPYIYDHSVNSHLIKPEPEEDIKPPLNTDFKIPLTPGPSRFIRHKPKIKTEIKSEIKTETDRYNYDNNIPYNYTTNTAEVKQEQGNKVEIQGVVVKEEPYLDDEFDYQNDCHELIYSESDSDEEAFNQTINFERLYNDMETHASIISSVKRGEYS